MVEHLTCYMDVGHDPIYSNNAPPINYEPIGLIKRELVRTEIINFLIFLH